MSKQELKSGDKVKLKHTDWPSIYPKGSVQTIVKITNGGLGMFFSNDNLYFSNLEVEPYQEPVQSNQMNKYNLKVGDEVQWFKQSTYTIGKVSETGITFKGEDVEYKFQQIDAYTKEGNFKVKDKVKEIVGYKLKDKKYEAAAKALCTSMVNWQQGDITLKVATETASIPRLREAGVLDLWFTPIYKSDDVVLSISGNRKVTVIKDKANIGSDSLTENQVRILHDKVTGLSGKIGEGGYQLEIPTIKVGCQEFTKQDIITVYQALIKLR